MDCSTVQHNLFAYLEDNLPCDIKREIEAHLSDCESCKQIFTGFRSIEAIMAKTRTVDPDPFVTTRIIQRIENELTGRWKKRAFILRPILVMLTVAGAIVIGYTVGKSRFERINGFDENQDQIENLKTGLFIHDFIDENNTISVN
jgi:predicted anti-sigma-YlaC factor YlaD